MSNPSIEPRTTMYLYCRAYQMCGIRREEDPRTGVQQITIVILAQRPRYAWRFWYIELDPGYEPNTVLFQRVTPNGQPLGEPHEIILDENAPVTMEIIRSRGGSM
jgi:hypothetical protein